MWEEALKWFNEIIIILPILSFIYCIQADNQHKDGWTYKGFCEDELRKYSEANKRLFFYNITYLQ